MIVHDIAAKYFISAELVVATLNSRQRTLSWDPLISGTDVRQGDGWPTLWMIMMVGVAK